MLDVALWLIAMGLLGAVSMLAYLKACKLVDWALIPSKPLGRCHGWERRGHTVVLACAGMAGVGVLIAVAALATGSGLE